VRVMWVRGGSGEKIICLAKQLSKLVASQNNYLIGEILRLPRNLWSYIIVVRVVVI